jgi:hypothetical protein
MLPEINERKISVYPDANSRNASSILERKTLLFHLHSTAVLWSIYHLVYKAWQSAERQLVLTFHRMKLFITTAVRASNSTFQ